MRCTEIKIERIDSKDSFYFNLIINRWLRTNGTHVVWKRIILSLSFPRMEPWLNNTGSRIVSIRTPWNMRAVQLPWGEPLDVTRWPVAMFF